MKNEAALTLQFTRTEAADKPLEPNASTTWWIGWIPIKIFFVSSLKPLSTHICTLCEHKGTTKILRIRAAAHLKSALGTLQFWVQKMFVIDVHCLCLISCRINNDVMISSCNKQSYKMDFRALLERAKRTLCNHASPVVIFAFIVVVICRQLLRVIHFKNSFLKIKRTHKPLISAVDIGLMLVHNICLDKFSVTI